MISNAASSVPDAAAPLPVGEAGGVQVVVGAAVLDPVTRPGRVLLAQRSSPPNAAGQWEFAGGKVEDGESEQEALVRECLEELGVLVRVAERVGPELVIGDGRYLLRVYTAYLERGVPAALDHQAIAWYAADELDHLDWIPGDRPIIPALRRVLAT